MLLAGDKCKGESRTAVQACNDWLRMGAGRSIADLWERYRNIQEYSEEKPPSASYNTLIKWSSRYGWKARAEAYDQTQEDEKNAKREEIMKSGLALDFERIIILKMVADKLVHDVEESGIYIQDLKISSKGEPFYIDVINEPLLRQLRGVLDDLAKETGGRVAKSDMNLSGDVSIKGFVEVSPDDWDEAADEAN